MSEGCEFGPFRFEPEPLVLFRGDAVVAVTPKALALLRVLLEHAGAVVTKQKLMAQVWPDAFVQGANLSVTVAALRKALGDPPGGGSYIETVPRRGYRFAAPLVGRAARAPLALAVLPFRELGASPDSSLGLGMADALIGRLTANETLRVRPTGAIVEYATAPRPPLVAAEELGVDAVIDGTLQRSGDKLLATVQLVPRGGGVKAWAGRLEGEVCDVFRMQDSLAEQVAAALSSRLPAAAGGGARQAPRFEAYEAYVRGRHLLARFDIDGVSMAFGCFGQAATLDPGFAAARAGLADAHLVFAFGGPRRPKEAFEPALECAEQALDRDPQLVDAHVTRALVALLRDWDWTAARRGLSRAAELSPGAPGTHLWLGLFLRLCGDGEAARREMARAREADPVSSLGATVRAWSHEVDGELELALELSRHAVRLHPDRALGHWRLGLALLGAGRAGDAVVALRQAVALTSQGPVMRCGLVRALAAAGERDEALAVLDQLEEVAARGFVSPTQRALAWSALDEPAKALDRIEEGAELRDPWIVFLRTEPGLDELMRTPRGKAVLDALGSFRAG
jgi:DNA-binding winged helix-turn-helix (wHTH) protein/tetratricopeptide (TPR) repeat protein